MTSTAPVGVLAATLLLAGAPGKSTAQTLATPTAATSAATSSMLSAVSAPRSGGDEFLIEAAGGVAGSMLGFGVIFLSRNACDDHDLACTVQSAFAGFAVGTVTSAAGTYLAGRAGGTEPSLVGAGLGAVAGVGVGVGLWYLFTDELDAVSRPVAAALAYTIAQGLTSALGSGFARRLR